MPNKFGADIVTLEEAKLFCRIDHDIEDPLVTLLIAAATDAVIEYADLWLSDEARIKLAILCHVARIYDERQDGADLPEAAARLIHPLRRLSV